MQKKGISLIVLVITIIVMIILAASVVISMSNTGIIDKAGAAVELTDKQQVQDLASLIWAEAYLDKDRTDTIENVVKDKLAEQGITADKWNIQVSDAGVTITNKGNNSGWSQDGYTVTNGNVQLTVGDYIDYKANVEGYNDTNGWQVLGAKNGELLVLSSNYVAEGVKIGSKVRAEVQENYPNAYLNQMHSICSAYKNGAGATGARSIEREDIDRIINYKATDFKMIDVFIMLGMPESELTEEDKEKFMGADYGRVITFTWNEEYNVNHFKINKDGVEKEVSYESDVTPMVFMWYDEEKNVWRNSKLADSGDIKDDLEPNITAKATNTGSIYLGDKLDQSTAAYKMLINNGSDLSYWLATPYKSVLDTIIYGYDIVSNSMVGGAAITSGAIALSAGDVIENSNNVRAVVSLTSTLELEPNGANSWKIKQ